MNKYIVMVAVVGALLTGCVEENYYTSSTRQPYYTTHTSYATEATSGYNRDYYTNKPQQGSSGYYTTQGAQVRESGGGYYTS